MAELPEHLVEYRKFLVDAEQKSQEDFDKTVLSLSGGALGISFVFLKDVIGSQPIELHTYLLGAWVCWGLSTLFVLVSFFLSHLTLRRAIQQIDEGTTGQGKFGGNYAYATATFNVLGAVLFFVGVISITVFASANITSRGVKHGNETPTSASSAPTPTPAAGPKATAAPTASSTAAPASAATSASGMGTRAGQR